METLIGWSIPLIVASPLIYLIRLGWKRRRIDGWHLRARWVRKLQGELDE